jgi:hypothetical protein
MILRSSAANYRVRRDLKRLGRVTGIRADKLANSQPWSMLHLRFLVSMLTCTMSFSLLGTALKRPLRFSYVRSMTSLPGQGGSLGFRQLFEKESSTYTYLLFDKASKEAVVIDPVMETAERYACCSLAMLTCSPIASLYRDFQLVKDLQLVLRYVVNTHVHADHVTGMYALCMITRLKV